MMKADWSINGKYYSIPENMMRSIDLYLNHGLEPGSFLSCVICNQLVGAVSNADAQNLEILPAYAALLYNEFPGNTWGSLDKMKAHMEKMREKE